MPDELLNSYHILELKPGATPEDIKQSYLDLVKVWHPDRFRQEPERLQHKAEEKLKAINVAYELLRQHQLSPASFRAATFTAATAKAPSTSVDVTASLGLQPAKMGKLWGYVGREGRLIIPPRFPTAAPFSEGLARVGNHELPSLCRYGFINAQGDLVIPAQFLDAGPFHGGLAGAVLSSKWGFIDQTGTFRISPEFERVGVFSEGLAAVRQRGRWGYVDDQGRYVINPRFDDAGEFDQGWAQIHVGNARGRLNRRGEVYLETQPAQFQ